MRSTEIVKITVVYGHIAENGLFVRNWFARKMAVTDKMVKNVRLSVKFERNPGAPPKIRKNTRHHGTYFNHYSIAYGVMSARFHTLQKKSVLVRLGAHVYKVHLTKNRTK